MPRIIINGKIVVCPRCQEKERLIEKKTWILEGGIKPNKFRVHLIKCGACGKNFRKLEPV